MAHAASLQIDANSLGLIIAIFVLRCSAVYWRSSLEPHQLPCFVVYFALVPLVAVMSDTIHVTYRRCSILRHIVAGWLDSSYVVRRLFSAFPFAVKPAPSN
ncbi:unnamed protein product [Prorocentrum cordatum]|uniref:Uncharacterized protein n=1 Tax=Prorocentrum cordatum TaxID=2364126 RepID=A0ABN9WZM1_9DINO|nr:unnamed protein product [Polarella glacialis]